MQIDLPSDEREDFERADPSIPQSNTTDDLSRAEDDDMYSEENFELPPPKTEEEVAAEIEGMVGGFLKKQQTFAALAARKGGSSIDQKVNEAMAMFQMTSASLIQTKMIVVNRPEYLEEKQSLLNLYAKQTGQKPQRAQVDEYEFLRVMSEPELQVALLALLPIQKLELNSKPEMCKYQIGTQSCNLLIRAN